MNQSKNLVKKSKEEYALTSGQEKALDAVETGGNIMITGGAGTGKSTVAKEIISRLENAGKSVLVVAPTGIAASTIGGATIHHAFGFPATAAINEKSMGIMTRGTKILQKTDVIVVDEISMVRVDLFDALAASIHKAEQKRNAPIQLVVIGDFCQLPPIMPQNAEKTLLESYYRKEMNRPFAFLGNEWDKSEFKTVMLTDIVRQSDPEFVRKLNLARAGKNACLDYFNSKTSPYLIPNAIHIVGKNKDVERENAARLNALSGTIYEYPTRFEGNLTKADLAGVPDILRIKEGARVMVTCNDISPKDYHKHNKYSRKHKPLYYNGSLGTVLEIMDCYDEDDSILVLLDNGKHVFFYPQETSVYGYEIDANDKIKKKLLGKFSQFPLRLAYATTIHKSQGQTYDTANVDPYCWESGQLYVALSRVRSIDCLHLDRCIYENDLVLDSAVYDFYKNLQAAYLEELSQVHR